MQLAPTQSNPNAITIITASRHFPHSFDKGGWWYAQMMWLGENQKLNTAFLQDQMELTNNVELELTAVQNALRRATEVDTPVEVRCGNSSIAKTIGEYYPNWKADGFKKRRGKPIVNLEIWHEINSFCEERNVIWELRGKLPVDKISGFDELLEFIEVQQNDDAFLNALTRKF